MGAVVVNGPVFGCFYHSLHNLKPKELNNGCPVCDFAGTMDLKIRNYKHLPANEKHIMVGKWWYYECPECKERFTTTESDEISISTFKMKRL